MTDYANKPTEKLAVVADPMLVWWMAHFMRRSQLSTGVKSTEYQRSTLIPCALFPFTSCAPVGRVGPTILVDLTQS